MIWMIWCYRWKPQFPVQRRQGNNANTNLNTKTIGFYLDHGHKFLSQRWIFQAFNSYTFTLGLSVFPPNIITLEFMHSPTAFLLRCLKSWFERNEKRIVCQTKWLCFKTWDVVVLWLYGQKRTIFVTFNPFSMSLKHLTFKIYGKFYLFKGNADFGYHTRKITNS